MRGTAWTIGTLTVWCCAVVQGITAEPHWAYQTPQRPALPFVSESQRAREPIDLFVLHELARRNLPPSVDAARPTLLRRATLTLNGVLPSVEELNSFTASGAPDAYEQQLDRLFASPQYGQRMASDWLDLARYADTHGFHADTEREQWRWRDWVIEQLNAGQPFDQFTIEQLAGDLLPQATLSQKIATGYLRNHMLTDENGAIPEECLTEIALDRVQTIGGVWLGQTFVCARCHDHKYDPLSQREYYSLVSIFNSLQEPALLVKGSRASPRLAAPTREQEAALEQLAVAIAAGERALESRRQAATADQQQWERQVRDGGMGEFPADAVTHLPLDTDLEGRTVDLARVIQSSRLLGSPQFSEGRFAGALLGDGATSIELTNWPELQGSTGWTLSLWLFPTTRDEVSLVAQADEALYNRGVEWSLSEGKLQIRLTQRRESDELIVRSREPIQLSRWQHLAVTFSPQTATRSHQLRLWRDGVELKAEAVGKLPAADVAATGPLRIGGRDKESSFRGLLDEVRLYPRALAAEEIQMLAGGNPIAGILRTAEKDRTAEQRDLVLRYYLEHHDGEYRKRHESLQRERARRELLLQQVPSVLAATELPRPREALVLTSGQYNQPGERVERQTPTFLSQHAKLTRLDRLGFAQWLVDPQHPLTGRVGVNRAWAQVFGTGLVTTPEDFGTRGARPSHPELLDYLARDWVDHGWDTKRLHRQLLSSATFRQRSEVSADLAGSDPANRWLARGPRVRLSAEQVRDAALDAAGLLNAGHGGPGVKPYQPGDWWKDLAYDVNALSAQSYASSTGSAVYRRSVYLFWKRTAPPVNLTAFDAPSRETCIAIRARTNTPQQALVLLNDPTFVEAARELALRVLTPPQLSVEQRLNQLMLRVLGREATAEERTALTEQLTADLAHYRVHPAAAQELLRVGQMPTPMHLSAAELAAWANVATVVLNLDEAVTNY